MSFSLSSLRPTRIGSGMIIVPSAAGMPPCSADRHDRALQVLAQAHPAGDAVHHDADVSIVHCATSPRRFICAGSLRAGRRALRPLGKGFPRLVDATLGGPSRGVNRCRKESDCCPVACRSHPRPPFGYGVPARVSVVPPLRFTRPANARRRPSSHRRKDPVPEAPEPAPELDEISPDPAQPSRTPAPPPRSNTERALGEGESAGRSADGAVREGGSAEGADERW